MNTDISIIQLIKQADIDVKFEISNLYAGRNVNIHIRNYLKKSPDFDIIINQIQQAKNDLKKADTRNKMFFADRLENIKKVKRDYIVNTLLLAESFSKMEIRTKRLKNVIELFEYGKVREADKILKEENLLIDQFNLIVYAEYLEKYQKLLVNE